jgi:nucleotide-binding universal stress UspA family protein
MAKNILLAVDAQQYAPEATEMALDLWHGPEDKIILLHVHEFAVGRFGRLQVDCPEGVAEKLIASIKETMAEAGVSVSSEIRETHVGHIARTIIEAADEHDAAMIVLGSARSTDLPHIPFGSVTHKVLHIARRPVMIVPRNAVRATARAHAATEVATATA